jgi:hypothetical protein
MTAFVATNHLSSAKKQRGKPFTGRDDPRNMTAVENSGRQADDEFRAGARAIATGRDAAPVQLDQGLHQGEARPEGEKGVRSLLHHWLSLKTPDPFFCSSGENPEGRLPKQGC